MARTRAIVRQWTLLRVLSQHADGLTIQEMARNTSVNPRTIRRDLKLFVEAGIPLREMVCRRNKKIWRVDPNGVKALSTCSTDDCLALYLTELLLEPLHDTRLFSAVAHCRDRVAATLSVSARKRLEEKASRLRNQVARDPFVRLSAQTVESLWDALSSNGSILASRPRSGASPADHSANAG